MTGVYTSVFFVVMNKMRYEGLPVDVRAAIDEMSGAVLSERFGELWSRWDAPVRRGADAPGHQIIVPDAEAMSEWRAALLPVTRQYVDKLIAGGFSNANSTYDEMRRRLSSGR